MSCEPPARASSIRPSDPCEKGSGLGAQVVGADQEVAIRLKHKRRMDAHAKAIFPVEGDQHGADELEAAAEEESEAVHTLPTPYQPTKSEYLDHCVTHCPYRVWCAHCNEGRGRETCHVSNGDAGLREAPTVSFDYAFVGDQSDEIKDQDEAEACEAGGGSYIKVLVVRDSRSKSQ